MPSTRNVLFPVLFLLGAGVLVGGCSGSDSDRRAHSEMPPDSVRTLVESEIASLNTLREKLAATIDTGAVGKETFKRVCAPVGKQAKEIGSERGWIVRQQAKKFRNPKNKLDERMRSLYEVFETHPDTLHVWTAGTREQTDGWFYARRIPVQSSCLVCHGPKEKRPAFVKSGYPEDRAYGFEPGDLRGLYTVFVPETPQTREQ